MDPRPAGAASAPRSRPRSAGSSTAGPRARRTGARRACRAPARSRCRVEHEITGGDQLLGERTDYRRSARRPAAPGPGRPERVRTAHRSRPGTRRRVSPPRAGDRRPRTHTVQESRPGSTRTPGRRKASGRRAERRRHRSPRRGRRPWPARSRARAVRRRSAPTLGTGCPPRLPTPEHHHSHREHGATRVGTFLMALMTTSRPPQWRAPERTRASSNSRSSDSSTSPRTSTSTCRRSARTSTSRSDRTSDCRVRSACGSCSATAGTSTTCPVAVLLLVDRPGPRQRGRIGRRVQRTAFREPAAQVDRETAEREQHQAQPDQPERDRPASFTP